MNNMKKMKTLSFENKSYEIFDEASRWSHIQDRVRSEAPVNIPLEYNSGTTAYVSGWQKDDTDNWIVPWSRSYYKPKATYSWAQKRLSIEGAFRVYKADDNNFALQSGDIVLRGLPTIFGSITLNNYLIWYDKNVSDGNRAGKFRVSQAKYTTENFYLVTLNEIGNGNLDNHYPYPREYGSSTSRDQYGGSTKSVGACEFDPSNNRLIQVQTVVDNQGTKNEWQDVPLVDGMVICIQASSQYYYKKETSENDRMENGQYYICHIDNGQVSWELGYKPCGVLKFISPRFEQFTIPQDTIVYVSPLPIQMATASGAHVFPKITSTDVKNAAAWIRAHEGLYDYSNNGRRRLEEAIISTPQQRLWATDCSGMVFQAFCHGAGKPVPAGSKAQISFGKVVQVVPPGQRIDIDLLQEGDIIGYMYASSESSAAVGKIGAIHHVAIAIKDDDTEGSPLHLWHQTSSFGVYRRKGSIVADGFEGRPRICTGPNEYKTLYTTEIIDPNLLQESVVYSDGRKRVFGPRKVAGTYVSGYSYTDASYNLYDTKVIVRWCEDQDSIETDPYEVEDISDDQDENEGDATDSSINDN